MKTNKLILTLAVVCMCLFWNCSTDLTPQMDNLSLTEKARGGNGNGNGPPGNGGDDSESAAFYGVTYNGVLNSGEINAQLDRDNKKTTIVLGVHCDVGWTWDELNGMDQLGYTDDNNDDCYAGTICGFIDIRHLNKNKDGRVLAHFGWNDGRVTLYGDPPAGGSILPSDTDNDVTVVFDHISIRNGSDMGDDSCDVAQTPIPGGLGTLSITIRKLTDGEAATVCDGPFCGTGGV